MNSDSEDMRDFDALLEKLCEEQLSDSDRARLEDYLRRGESWRRRYLDYVDLHATFLLIGNDATGLGTGRTGLSGGTPLPANVSAMSKLARASRLALVALLLLVGCAAWLFVGRSEELVAERERQPIASLAASKDARWQKGFKPAAGAKLMEGQAMQLVTGRAQVSMVCGAELVLQGPCSIALISPNQVLLNDGVLSVNAADWAEGFTVATRSVHIVDLGKRFAVSMDAKSGAVEAHAIDGKLRVLTTEMREEERPSMFVSAGEAIRILPASNQSTRLKADASLFDPGLDDTRPFKPVGIYNTGRNLVPGDEDSHWRIVKSSDKGFRGTEQAIVCNAYTYKNRNIYLPNDPDLSQWISVSNPVDGNCPPNKMYTFETEFDLTGYELSTVTIVGQVLADNGVTAVRINGQPVEFTPWIDNLQGALYNAFHKIEITEGFVEGVNVIQFDVWNGVNAERPSVRNSMALRVEWQAFGRLKPAGPLAFLRALEKSATTGGLPVTYSSTTVPARRPRSLGFGPFWIVSGQEQDHDALPPIWHGSPLLNPAAKGV
jgi:hypothetical protein